MAGSQGHTIDRASRIQSALGEVGEIPDYRLEAIAAHEELRGRAWNLSRGVGEAIATVHAQRDKVKRSLRTAWDLCVSLESIVKVMPPTATAGEALTRPDKAGGFTLPRARRRAANLIGALEQFPVDFSALNRMKAELVAILQQPMEDDREMARLRSVLKTTRAELRAAVKTLDQENEKAVTIVRATFPPGTKPRNVFDSVVPPRTPPPKGRRRKKKHEETSDASETPGEMTENPADANG